MIYKIITTLRDELVTAMGPNSSYAEKIENFFVNDVRTVTGNNLMGIAYDSKDAGDYEIGQNFAFTYSYNIDIIILVKHSDRISALELLSTLEKRMIKTLATSTIRGVTEIVDSTTETVNTIKLLGANYKDPTGDDMVYGLTTRIQINTQLQI
jgi:hypothetical protein